MTMLLQILAGAVLGTACVAALGLLAPKAQRFVYAFLLFFAAAVYLFLALAFGGLLGVLLEIVGIVIFAAFAVFGFQRHLWLLAAGWLAHPLWDIAFHGTPGGYAPAWYAFVCIGFDIAFAIGIILSWRRLARRGERHPLEG